MAITAQSHGSVKTFTITSLAAAGTSATMDCTGYQYAIFYGNKASDLLVVDDADGTKVIPAEVSFYKAATAANAGYMVRLPRRIKLKNSGASEGTFAVELHKFNVQSTGR